MAEHEADGLRQLMEQDLRELTLLLAGIGGAAASQRPQPDAWSVNELLALLSERIRARFTGLGEALHDPARVPSLPAVAVPEKLSAIVTTCGTAPALIARCRGDFEDLANLVAEVPSERLAAEVAASATGGEETKVALLAWVRVAYAEEFQDVLATVRAIRDGTRLMGYSEQAT